MKQKANKYDALEKEKNKIEQQLKNEMQKL